MSPNNIKTPSDSESYLAEIVGEESLFGQRIGAGKMLQLMDLAAATAAWQHSRSPLVTLAFDRIELVNMICHMDYVRYDAYVIKVGHSSMVVKVDGFVKSPTEMEIHPAHSGVITMVAIDDEKKANPNIPKLAYHSDKDLERKNLAVQRDKLLAKRKAMFEEIDRLTQIPDDHLIDYYERTLLIPPQKSQLAIKKVFLPKSANALGIVFGGHTIELMEELALATARQFTGNFQMVTIAMEDVYFWKPLNLNNLVEMTATVTYVANTTLVVEVKVNIIDAFHLEKSYLSNKGSFTVLNYDRSGRKKKIKHGLDLAGTDFHYNKEYLKEQKKYEIRKKMKHPSQTQFD